jgi:hypothetical protein
LLHSAANTSAHFDDPNLVSCAGLVPVMRLAQRCDLAGLVGEHVAVTDPVGANARLKIPAIVTGMIAGADSIDELDVLRHGGMTELFGGVCAPSTTLGSFLHGFHWSNVRQLEVVSRRLLAELAATTPVLTDAGGDGASGHRLLPTPRLRDRSDLGRSFTREGSAMRRARPGRRGG